MWVEHQQRMLGDYFFVVPNFRNFFLLIISTGLFTIFRSGEGEAEGGEITLHFTTTAVSDAAVPVSSSTLERAYLRSRWSKHRLSLSVCSLRELRLSM